MLCFLTSSPSLSPFLHLFSNPPFQLVPHLETSMHRPLLSQNTFSPIPTTYRSNSFIPLPHQIFGVVLLFLSQPTCNLTSNFYVETELRIITNIFFSSSNQKSTFLVLLILHFFAMGFDEKNTDLGTKLIWIWIKTLGLLLWNIFEPQVFL